MSDITNVAESLAAEATPAEPTAEEAKALADSGQAEGTTPEEVAQVLKGAGMKVDADPTAPAEDEPAEEAEPEEAAAEPSEDPGPEEVANEEPIEPETDPKAEVASDGPDFSFEVEDSEGQTFKIMPGDKMEDILAGFTPKNNGQIIDILDKLREAKDAQRSHEYDQARQADEANTAKAVETIQKGWQSEFKDMGVTDDKRQGEIFAYMRAENDKREQAGRPLIASVADAKLGLEAQERVEADKTAAKAEKETARKNGGLVGGSSAPASSGSPVYRAGSARNANEAIRAMNLLA